MSADERPAKSVAAKTVYNRFTDRWEVWHQGARVETRSAILALPAGASVTLKRKGDADETVTIAGADDPPAAAGPADVIVAALDSATGLSAESRRLLEVLFRQQLGLAAKHESLASIALGVAERTAALNTGLSVALAQAYGVNATLRAQLEQRPGESEEHWLERVIRHGPEIAGIIRLLRAPLPGENDNTSAANLATKEG